MRRSLHPDASRREGVILMVVLTMLTLFAVVGLMAVLYAQNSARSSLNFAKAWQLPFRGTGGGDDYAPPDIPPTELFRWAFGQLIYDVPDNVGGVQSAIRGHSLARTMYGYADDRLNIQPFNGLGRIDSIYTSGTFNGLNDRELVNYTYFPGMPLRDPEYPGSRGNPTQPRGGAFVGGANPPVTYPNLDNLALAASRADGTNLMPSFHRRWLFNPSHQFPDPSNPNWTDTAGNIKGRYLTLRPRPSDHYGFPYPTDDGGDVKNKTGYPGGNDSIWIDLGYPERVAADGRRYKPLFAFRAEDLDGKINLNAAGNLMGGVNPNETHASNLGMGKWEQSILKLFQQSGSPAPQEWRNLFLGNSNAPLIPSRYGQDRQPFNGVQPINNGKGPRHFAPGDQNAVDETNNNAPTGPIKILPGSPFPVFPGGYESGSQAWAANARHFNYFNPLGPSGLAPPTFDSLFPISDLKKLLVNSYTGVDAMSANVVQLAPVTFGTDPASLRRRNLITVLSMDMARLGIAPWLYDQGTSGATGYASPGDPQLPPSGGTFATSLTDGAGNPRLRRALEASLEAINLDQLLRLYPHQTTPATNYNRRFDDDAPTMQAYADAQSDRQNMASEIFKRLLLVTGVKAPADVTQPTDAELIPLRWMAQLAANIIDFIDEDEINTPFKFYPIAYQFFGGAAPYPPALDAPATAISSTTAAGEKIPRFWVFGTELPPVVLSEAYAQFEYKTDPTMMNMETSGVFAVKVWAELFNPFPKTVPGSVQQQDAKGVPLHIGAGAMGTMWYSPYKLAIANAGGPVVPRADNDNVNGAPDKVRTAAVFDGPTVPRVDQVAPDPAMAVNPQQANGFFLMGPKDKTRNDTIKPARVPGDVPYFQTDQMKWDVMYNKGANTWTDPANGNNADDRGGVTVLLRRLANPHLPEQGDPTGGNYNPYITMDYIDKVQLNDVTTPKSDAVAAKSQGKKQPYASDRGSQIDDQAYGADPLNQHTLGVANSNSGNNNWLVHLDRQVISPFELLNVSGFRQHMLTQKFNGNHGQRVQWFDEDLAAGQSHRLYRLFAFLATPDRAAGVSANGRVPGKVNLNTIWDKEVFESLCDASASNTFTAADVDNAWNALIGRRQLAAADRPILDAGAAFLPPGDPVAGANGRGLDDTWLKLHQTGNGQPYLKNELLTKIANSVTTRSNVFAVWLTTGFFEVVNHPTTGLPVLGAEIGRSQGQEIRYRFFAIVDRTQLVIAPLLTSAGVAGGITPSNTPQAVSVGTLSGTITYNGGSTVPWSIAAGSVVVIDRGTPSEETVVVTAADTTNNTFTAVFRREHSANMTVTMHGNPGPQPNWDPASPSESLVVPYWELL